jgi:hypothetical protein
MFLCTMYYFFTKTNYKRGQPYIINASSEKVVRAQSDSDEQKKNQQSTNLIEKTVTLNDHQFFAVITPVFLYVTFLACKQLYDYDAYDY